MVSGKNQSRRPSAKPTSFGRFYARGEDERRRHEIQRRSELSGVSTEREYDVFLSFRGSDTREGVADHLCTRLVDAGLTVPIFLSKDAGDHPMGSRFGSQLPQAIARSKISIPIIFPYAASKWSYGKSTGHVVMPIFDGVEHLHARHLTGSFWEASFHAHKVCLEQRDVEAGQQALRDDSFLQGWESEKMANGHQGEFVRIVVEMVLSELRQGFRVEVPETLVGIDDQVKKIIALLDTTSNCT